MTEEMVDDMICYAMLRRRDDAEFLLFLSQVLGCSLNMLGTDSELRHSHYAAGADEENNAEEIPLDAKGKGRARSSNKRATRRSTRRGDPIRGRRERKKMMMVIRAQKQSTHPACPVRWQECLNRSITHGEIGSYTDI